MSPETDPSGPNLDYLKAAFLAMEPTNCFISLARQSGGGSITTEVQASILEHCINNVGKGIACNRSYVKNILKKVIVAAESTCDVVVEGLYEQFAYHMASHTEDDLLKEKNKIYKQISLLFPCGYDGISSSSMNLVVLLQCSLNMLEGDTGCALWPSSLFLSEFILSYPKIFSSKFCFEVQRRHSEAGEKHQRGQQILYLHGQVGSGVGLVGISLTHVGASKVVLTDGDMSSLANMKHNLELNQLSLETKVSESTCKSPNMVECKYLPWESASEDKLQSYQPDIVLGADIIYDPLCVPHLIQVLSILLNTKKRVSVNPKATDMNGHVFAHHGEQRRNNVSHNEVNETPVAYIAQVIRNYETFNYFLKLADEAHLSVVDITESKRPLNFLPYMLSYDRSAVHLYIVSSSCN